VLQQIPTNRNTNLMSAAPSLLPACHRRRAEARECVWVGTGGAAACWIYGSQDGARLGKAAYGQVIHGSEGECHWTRIGYDVWIFSLVWNCSLLIDFSYAGRVKILGSVDPDLVVIRHLREPGFESHSLDACFHSSLVLYMVYANVFIIYTTPIIKLS
jgi:hypothetical protein